ncbi:MAG: TIGR00730 family Rossman fold protein [Calditrichaeota bacterium]|nr:MAG: TIGR00730 family Rossman fold protein [Calditrichota bacterium]MBL1207909.1 TIGR00730 family Rossman fold protein [Calditrichota bacterium]
MKKVAVFCGSNSGADIIYKEEAKKLGLYLAQNNIGLVYGGGKVGLMGIIADAILENNGSVTGIMPDHLYQKEVAHERLTELQIVQTMHERKALMEKLSDAFIAMPGGMGTLDEIVEIFTWSQLNLHTKPFGFYNIENFFGKLFDFFEHMVKNQFLHQGHYDRIAISDNPKDLLTILNRYMHGEIDKWF